MEFFFLFSDPSFPPTLPQDINELHQQEGQCFIRVGIKLERVSGGRESV